MRIRLLRTSASFGCYLIGAALFPVSVLKAQTDSVIRKNDTAAVRVATSFTAGSGLQPKGLSNTVPMNNVNAHPYISLQQMLKGNAAGVHIQEPSGEPGTEQNIFLRGISSPLLSKRELFDQQAAVFLNGIPLVQDNPFVYEIQKYDFNRVGPATNLLAAINPSNVQSIEVITDPLRLAALGPLAANGAIWITTKNAHAGYREISVNAYTGLALRPQITPVNAAYENDFRKPFYDRFGTINDRLNYPPFLRDSTNADYYGPANWSEAYYKNALLYNVDMSLTGGSERANFRFFTGLAKNAGNADNTSINRYTGSFFINVAPLPWVMVSSMINYNKLDRTRNRNVRDRLAEQRYIPDLINPLTPNQNLYNAYLNEFDKSIDRNSSDLVQGYLSIAAKVNKLHYKGQLSFDYNEGVREAFWPTTLLEGNNFVSNYFGYNQRTVISNTLSYSFDFTNRSKLSLEAGQSFQSDEYKYNYGYAYNTPNDFIKINVVNGDPNAADYLDPRGFRVYYFPGKMQSRLASFFGQATYDYNQIFTLSAVARRDGSSNMQPDNRWFTSFTGAAGWNIKNHLLGDSKISSLLLNLSFAQLGKLVSDDRFGAGPQYRVDLGWSNEPTIGSYAGLPGISRPYTSGWVGYGIPWAYSDKLNIGLQLGLAADRVRISLDAYSRDDKDMLLPIPVASEWGYTGAYLSGLRVANKGLDLSLLADVLPASRHAFSWTLTANANYNQNTLKALPGGLTELVIGSQKLVVGQRVDAFWLLQNRGGFATNAEVPVNTQTGQPLNFKGVALKAGDPRWADLNGDYVINDADKTLTGHYLPKVTGGLGSSFGYKAFTFDFQFYFALRHKVLNRYAASRLDFINTEVANNINSVKEITFWEKKMDLTDFPVYNPWSTVVAYRPDQDLFLDDASFVKLRSLTLRYDLLKNKAKNASRFLKGFQVYATATNLFTITPFKADDPELVNYNGIYDGYGLPIPRSIIAGVKLDL
ncbi:SusC/RagA family TonB-linked outer membrane protein [Flavisolibacter sp. BT320]|nr:SusC/RagA family TonB-linked outer membrane protein [Flavisolibacter longurius]